MRIIEVAAQAVRRGYVRAARGGHSTFGTRLGGIARGARRAAWVAGLVGSGGALVGCSVGPGADEDAGSTFTPISEGSVVAVLEHAGTSTPDFILSGNVPVPPGTFPRADGRVPFAVADYDGTLVETQVEVVSRYPSNADGADVLEVIAKVRPDPSLPPGMRARYKIYSAVHDDGPPPDAPGVEDLQNGPINVPPSVKTMLANPSSIVIRGHDCFGNVYTELPLAADNTKQILRHGPMQTTLRTYDVLRPAPTVSGPQGTLKHLHGVHAYLSTFSGQDFVELDVRFHNGHDGNLSSTDLDDPLDKLYFKDIEVVVPSGWLVQQHFDDPYFGEPYTEGATTVFPVVRPMDAGKMHVMRWQAQFHRRLILSPSPSFLPAKLHQVQNGKAFCVRGTDPDEGHEYYSWWNEHTARYFPQAHQLPSLDHVGLGSIREDFSSELQGLENVVANGGSWGDYPVDVTVLGWGHPYGVGYGGMTGGAEIHVSDGLRLAASGAAKGYRKTMLVHRMHTDRMPTALYKANGHPSSVEDWLVHTGGDGSNDYVPFEHFLYPVLGSGDPFGVGAAQAFQVNHVQGTGLQPGYENAHFGFDGHDYQHFIRYTRSAKVLVWLGNDMLAKDDLRMQAENFRLSYHPYKNSSFGNIQGSGMRSAMNYVADHFMVGFPFGRGEGWGTDCVNAAYRTSDGAWRLKVRPWYDQLAMVINDGQASCSGFIQAVVHTKFVDGLYRARQAIEQAIVENMIRGMIESVYRGQDVALTAMMEAVLRDSLLAFISTMAWFPGEPAPWTYTGVAPRLVSEPPWCSMSQMPADAYTPAHENYQNWHSFAYGYELVGSPLFLDKAAVQVGGGDLLTKLENGGTNNIENRAALLALMQHLNGDI